MSIRWKALLALAGVFTLFLGVPLWCQYTWSPLGVCGWQLLLLCAAWLTVQITVVRPLERLKTAMSRTEEDRQLVSEINVTRNDELGDLARQFHALTQRIADADAQSLSNQHQASQANLAADVLHNVVTTLTTINAACDGLLDRVRVSKVQGMTKAMQLIESHQDNLAEYLQTDPKGSKLVEYLSRLSGLLAAEQGQAINELHSLQRTVTHLKDIVALEQSYALAPIGFQPEDVGAILEDVLTMHADELQRLGVTVVRHVEATSPVTVQKGRLMQVLANLVRNAIDAMREQKAGLPEGSQTELCLAISASPRPDGGVAIEITDTGAGIAVENLPRLFTNGVSTRGEGRGFGLYFCQNAVVAMGGKISVASKGPGCGATFTVALGNDANTQEQPLSLTPAPAMAQAA